MIMRTVRLAAAALAATGVVAATAATPASAMPHYAGIATATGGLTLRVGPSPYGEARGSIAQGQRFAIQCRVDATTVDGITTWYSAPDYGPTWVSGRFVKVVGGGSVRYCGDGRYHAARSTANLYEREGTSTGDRASGSVRSGARLNLVCFADGQRVGSTYRWYNLDNGAWVSARYVSGAGSTPACV